MAEIVYVLCAVTSFTCAMLLWRGYRRTPARLLLWSALCFIGLALNNAFLLLDLLILPGIDLSLFRGLSALVGLGCLLFGMIWDAE